MDQTPKEVKSLTSLRAVGAGLVFFYHVNYLRHQVPAQTILDAVIQAGFVGVSIFFVLSGFGLTLGYYRQIQDGNFRWGSYLKRRGARILPLYYLLLAGIAVWGVHLNLMNVTLTQGFFSKLHQTGIIVAWSLTAEISFYFLLPLVLSVIVNLKRISSVGFTLMIWSLMMLGFGLLLMLWSNYTGLARPAGFMGDPAFVVHRTVFGYIFDFSVGIFAAVLYLRRGRPYNVNVSTLLNIVGVAGLIGFDILICQYPDSFSRRILLYGADISIGVLIISLTCETTVLARVLSWSPFVYLGRMSYAVYLLQLTQLVWFMSNWPAVLFYIGTTLISAVLYQFFEEPVRKLLLRKPKPAQRIMRREAEPAH